MKFKISSAFFWVLLIITFGVFCSRWYFGREARDAINLFRQQHEASVYSHFPYEGKILSPEVWLLSGGYLKFREVKVGPADWQLDKGEVNAFLMQVDDIQVFCPPPDSYNKNTIFDNGSSNYNWSGYGYLTDVVENPLNPIEIIQNFEAVKRAATKLPIAGQGFEVFRQRVLGVEYEFFCFRKYSPKPITPTCEGAEKSGREVHVFRKPTCS